jgi:hypothetical protein
MRVHCVILYFNPLKQQKKQISSDMPNDAIAGA